MILETYPFDISELLDTEEGIAEYLRLVCEDGSPAEIARVETYFQWRPQLSDPDDEIVLEAAVNGRADVLVTHNVRDFSSRAERFGLRVLRPGEFLKESRQ